MDRKREISELREQAALVEKKILEQIEARARIARQMRLLGEAESAGAEPSDPYAVEAADIHPSPDVPVESARRLLHQVRAMARAIERPARVAYVSPEGGLCHLSAMDHFGVEVAFVECATVQDALDEVARERASHAVIAFESTVDGLLQPAITALAGTDLVFVAERTAGARYSLLSRTGNPKDADKVYATSTAHAACERFLARVLPRATVLDVKSPRVAVQLAQEDHGSTALVPEATDAPDLAVVQANVGDEANLAYRYGVVSARPASRSGRDTTTLLFSVADQPGSLFEVLRHFAERGINLKKLQSRPVHGEAWDYVFYVEVTGHVTDRPVVTALEAIKRSTKYLRLLGSFPSRT